MTDHTPGPWQVGTGHGTARDHAVCAGPHIIAKVNGDGYPTGLGWSPESAANARLIASAPDLLRQRDALLAALNEFMDVNDRRRHPLGLPGEGISYDYAAAHSKCRAVISSCEAGTAKQGAACKESTL